MSTPVDVGARSRTPLLTLITQESLDEGYEHAARRRPAAAHTSTPVRRTPRWTAAAVVAVFGVLVAVAAAQTSAQSGVADSSRESLLERIDASRQDVATLQKRLLRLRELNVGLQDTLDEVTVKERSASARAVALGGWSGYEVVTGPGVVITVDDARDGEAVRDEDLALLVNGLWQAGAEAISVNGKRLTVRSALRNSGAAINLNGPPPMSPPYVVSAIGDDRTLLADLADTTTGMEFNDVADTFDFRVSMDTADDLTLPAAPDRQLRLRYAKAGDAKQKSKNSRKEDSP